MLHLQDNTSSDEDLIETDSTEAKLFLTGASLCLPLLVSVYSMKLLRFSFALATCLRGPFSVSNKGHAVPVGGFRKVPEAKKRRACNFPDFRSAGNTIEQIKHVLLQEKCILCRFSAQKEVFLYTCL